MSTLANDAEPSVVLPAAGADPGARLATIAGRYELDLRTPLGAGGMALVYRGKDLRTRRDVAVKTLRPEHRDDPETRARFRREARLLAFLAHPNVVRVFDFVEDRGASWVVLEQVPGRSLEAVLTERGPFPPAEAALLVEQAASALSHLHARGLVHLDVKPRNLLLADDHRLKLINFGLAQPAGQPQEEIGGRTFGTAAYLAPEQVAGEPVGVATDVYALGCVAYELVTGRPPFVTGRPGERKDDVIRARLERLPAPPTRVRPDLKLPAWVDDVLLWALAPEPGGRYRSVDAFVRVFRAGVDGERLVDIGTTGRVAAVDPPPRRATMATAPSDTEDAVTAGAAIPRRETAPRSQVDGRLGRRSAAIRRGLWRWVGVVAAADALLAAVLVLSQGAIPGLYEPTATLEPGADARVVLQDARVRNAPTLNGTPLWALDAGERVRITGGPEPAADGGRWWPVALTGERAEEAGYIREDGIAAVRRAPWKGLSEAVGLE